MVYNNELLDLMHSICHAGQTPGTEAPQTAAATAKVLLQVPHVQQLLLHHIKHLYWDDRNDSVSWSSADHLQEGVPQAAGGVLLDNDLQQLLAASVHELAKNLAAPSDCIHYDRSVGAGSDGSASAPAAARSSHDEASVAAFAAHVAAALVPRILSGRDKCDAKLFGASAAASICSAAAALAACRLASADALINLCTTALTARKDVASKHVDFGFRAAMFLLAALLSHDTEAGQGSTLPKREGTEEPAASSGGCPVGNAAAAGEWFCMVPQQLFHALGELIRASGRWGAPQRSEFIGQLLPKLVAAARSFANNDASRDGPLFQSYRGVLAELWAGCQAMPVSDRLVLMCR